MTPTKLPDNARCVAVGCRDRAFHGDELKLDRESGKPLSLARTPFGLMHFSCYKRRVREVLHDAGLR